MFLGGIPKFGKEDLMDRRYRYRGLFFEKCTEDSSRMQFSVLIVSFLIGPQTFSSNGPSSRIQK